MRIWGPILNAYNSYTWYTFLLNRVRAIECKIGLETIGRRITELAGWTMLLGKDVWEITVTGN